MKRSNEVLVGITATAALILAIVGSLYLARGGLQPGYKLFAKFTWGAGLKQGQPVLLSGVNIGYVDKVAIREDGLLIVQLRIRKEYKIPRGTTATIEPNGFFGDQLVALHPDRPNPQKFSAGDTLLAGHATPSVGDVLLRVDTIAANISVLTASLKRDFVDADGLADLRRAVKRADVTMQEIAKVADEQNAELKKTQAALRKAVSAVDSVAIDSTLRSIKAASASFSSLMSDFKETSQHLNATLDKASSGPGTMGKFMGDPALYDHVVNLTTRLDSLIEDFKKNPRKYIKLSIF